MQHHSHLKQKDEEGFATSRIEVKEVSNNELHRPIRDKIPEPKELIQITRPQDSLPRVLDNGIHITTLPSIMNNLEENEQEPTSSSISLIKIQFNGKGKTLYDYFSSSDFICIFDKYRDKRTAQEIYYDFTSKIKIVEHTNDYNWKLYKKLNEFKLQSLTSMRPFDFDSNFESGNTRFVYKQYSKPNNYYVLLENDTNTHGYNQWFFFRVRNKQPGQITIHVMNLIKKQNLYRQGMKVALFSTREYEKNKKGWSRGGTKIGYNNTGIQRTTKQNENHYCLSFSYEFQQENDCVYFALTVPYTYSRVGQLFNYASQACSQLNIPYSQKNLGYTLSNNKINSMRFGFTEQKKKTLVILARQHPCETMGSFVCEGIVKYLVNDSLESRHLLSSFNFVVIPMVNPDGVVEGNSRCNLSGVDLNRQWTDPMKQLTPQTHFIKKYLQKIHQQTPIQAIVDLHGHSKKTNSFFYCCEKKDKSEMRLFSILMSKFSPQFDYTSCTYGLSKDKLSTVRGRFNLLGINCYTLENSYYGWYDKSYRCFTMKSFSIIGESVIKSLFMMYCSQYPKEEYDFDRVSVLDQIKKNIFRIQAEEKNQKEDSGSDSDPDGDLFDVQERLDTLKMKLLLKSNSNQTFLKGLSSVSKSVKYQSPLVVSNNKRMDRKSTQTVELKRRKKKHSLNLQSEDMNIEVPYEVFKKPTQPVMKAKKQKIATQRPQVIKETRLASSLNKPTRLQYFAVQEQKNPDRTSANLSKDHSNQKLQQFPAARKHPSSSYRTQTKFLTAIKNRTRISTKVHTEGSSDQPLKPKRVTLTEANSVNEHRSKSPNQKELKIIEVNYLQQRRERAMFLEQTAGVFKSREMKRGNLISDTKFKRFQSFIENNTDKVALSLQKQIGNRVFYRFPVL